jgi:hypothetical protein
MEKKSLQTAAAQQQNAWQLPRLKEVSTPPTGWIKAVSALL